VVFSWADVLLVLDWLLDAAGWRGPLLSGAGLTRFAVVSLRVRGVAVRQDHEPTLDDARPLLHAIKLVASAAALVFVLLWVFGCCNLASRVPPEGATQVVLHYGLVDAIIQGLGSGHTLRCGSASRLVGDGTDRRLMHSLFGCLRLETTLICVRVASRGRLGVVRPVVLAGTRWHSCGDRRLDTLVPLV
jgi:hypothetical protein